MKEANTSIFGGPHPATQEPLSESAKAALFSPLSDAAAEALSKPAKHTPGPWYTGEPFAAFEGGTLRFHISQADGAQYTPHYSDVAHLVAETVSGELLEIQRANARLIAAAMARAAIAKATEQPA